MTRDRAEEAIAKWRTEVIENPDHKWWLQVFEASDMVMVMTKLGKSGHKRRPGEVIGEGMRVVPGGWDHEHCCLCFATISARGDDLRSGYTDGNDWACEECYAEEIAPHHGTGHGDT
ncbi:MAG TPA: hypothetical protein VMT19_11510 [Thermoanaerobaculaceae bacterium]|nr:hypothetical protein [Thermoanaerobaculaceae bacterium]